MTRREALIAALGTVIGTQADEPPIVNSHDEARACCTNYSTCYFYDGKNWVPVIEEVQP